MQTTPRATQEVSNTLMWQNFEVYCGLDNDVGVSSLLKRLNFGLKPQPGWRSCSSTGRQVHAFPHVPTYGQMKPSNPACQASVHPFIQPSSRSATLIPPFSYDASTPSVLIQQHCGSRDLETQWPGVILGIPIFQWRLLCSSLHRPAMKKAQAELIGPSLCVHVCVTTSAAQKHPETRD